MVLIHHFRGLQPYLKWVVAFLIFPIGGLLGRLVADPSGSVIAALLVGAVAGAIIGAGQWLAMGRRAGEVRWIPATSMGLGVSFAAAQALGLSASSAAALGAVTGLGVGLAQFPLLTGRLAMPLIWVATTTVAWAVGWIIASSIGVKTEAGWPVFGVSGAIVAQALTGLVLIGLGRPPRARELA